MLNKRIVKVLLLAICLIYVGLRIWRLCDSCLWFDEIFSIHASSLDWPELIRFIALDLIHPPLSYILLKLWITAGGESMGWVRAFPVLFSILSIFPAWHLCRELKISKPAALTGLFLVAVNGALIKYSQEVRMYAPFLFFSVTSIWLFARFYFRGKSFWVLVAASILSVNTHYFGWFVVAAEIIVVLIARRPKLPRTLLMAAISAISFIPWLVALYQFKQPAFTFEENIGWMKRPFIREVFELAVDFVEPVYFQLSSGEPAGMLVIALPMLLVIAAAKIYYFSEKRDPQEWERISFLSVFAAVPTILALALSWLLPYSIWGSRHLIIVFVPILILAGVFIGEAKEIRMRIAATTSLVILSLAAFAMDIYRGPRSFIWCAWEPLAKEWVDSRMPSQAPATLYTFEDLVAYNYWFATRDLPNRRIVLVKDVEGMVNDPAYFLPRGFDGVEAGGLKSVEGDELWVTFRQATRPDPIGEHESTTRQFEVPVTNFENLGYTVVEVKKRVVEAQTAYLLRMKKAQPPAEP